MTLSRFLPFIYFYLWIYNMQGQSTPSQCGFDVHEKMLLQNKKYAKEQQEFERKYYSKFENKNLTSRAKIETIFLPVVFHIIHNNGSENIPDSQITKGLQYLNAAFANEGIFYNNKGVNTNIQFCLAKRNEKEQVFNGIKRHVSLYTDMSNFGGFEWLRDSINFNYNQYINIQVVKNACLGTNCGVSGFAGTHRVVVEADYVLTSTLIHEMGHFLGLMHTFRQGCKNDDCLKDGDFVCDTPPDNRTYDGCNNNQNSCDTDANDSNPKNPYRHLAIGGLGDQPDDNSNYMDYNVTSCRDHFTQGQADRMRFVIEERYGSLLLSEVCKPECDNPVMAAFDMQDKVIAGTKLILSNLSLNGDSYRWSVDNMLESTSKDLSYNFITPGITQIKLVAMTTDPNCKSDSISQTIKVICPIKACIQYAIKNQYIYINECTTSGLSLTWEIRKGNKVLFSSTNPQDSFYVKPYDFVRLCLTVDNGICAAQHCIYINTTKSSNEICDNEQDDDDDGLIDGFDTDCPCDGNSYYSYCKPECEIIPDTFPEIKMKMKWQSEVLAKRVEPPTYVVVNIRDSLRIYTIGSIGSFPNVTSFMVALDANDGKLVDSFLLKPIERNQINIYTPISIIKENIDKYSIIFNWNNDKIYKFDLNGKIDLVADLNKDNLVSHGVADFNNDGDVEIYSGPNVINGQNGKILYSDAIDCNFNNVCSSNHSVAADVLGDDGKLELITGARVYDITFNNLNDSIGNKVNMIRAPGDVLDGRCGVADFDSDGQLDVVVARGVDKFLGTPGGVWIWNPRTGNLIAKGDVPSLHQFGRDGGAPFIGDVDGDCVPEIGVAFYNELRMYKFDGSTNLKIMYKIKTTDNSGFTGVTMFDFNQDNRQELVYRDETSLRIFDGSTGITIDSTRLLSGTGLEYPIVVDINKDGNSEIIVSGSLTDKNEHRIFCFESASTPWAPSRSIWNQYAYNPTFVNDDLTIPRYQQNTAHSLQNTDQCSREVCNTPYNNFMVQATYRTQEGCYVWPDLNTDLSISASSRCIGDSLELCFYPSASRNGLINKGVLVSCWNPNNFGNEPALLDTMTIYLDTVCIMMPRMTGLDSMLISINNSGTSYPPLFDSPLITECDYSNNTFMLDLMSPDLSIDVIDYTCKGDSLSFTIVIENNGEEILDTCIGGGYYYIDPSIGEPLEITNWCLDFKEDKGNHKFIDTIVFTIPMPIGKTEMYWTINDQGFGPGTKSSEISKIFECNYDNNSDFINFDITTKILSIGPDTSICFGSIVTRDPGEWLSYEWSDLTLDRINSFALPGQYWVKTTDHCKRQYLDTFYINDKILDKISLGPDSRLCPGLLDSFIIKVPYDSLVWSPSSMVSCDTCRAIQLLGSDDFELSILAYTQGCATRDTVSIDYKQRVDETRRIDLCDGDTFTYGSASWSQSGIYTYAVGLCDSLLTLDIRTHTSVIRDQVASICAGDSLRFGSQWLTSAGNYTQTMQTSVGCDSTIRIQLSILPLQSIANTIQVCAGKVTKIHGIDRNAPGVFNQTFSSAVGCDSTSIITLTWSPPIAYRDTMIVCAGKPVSIHGIVRATQGLYAQAFKTAEGCDSTAAILLTYTPPIAYRDTIRICASESATIHGTVRTTQGLYAQAFKTGQGCDSTAAIYLSISPYKVTDRSFKLCDGDSIIINNQIITKAGIVVDTFKVSTGCDEIIKNTVSLLLPSITTQADYLCPDSVIRLDNGQIINKPGIFNITGFKNAAGCDSTIVLTVQDVPRPPQPTLTVDCEKEQYSIIAPPSVEWFYNDPSGIKLDTLIVPKIGGDITIPVSSIYFCNYKSFQFNLPPIPDISDIPTISDQQQTSNSGISLTIALDPSQWRVIWSPSALASCDTCLTTVISTPEDTTISLLLTHISGCQFTQSFRISRTPNISFDIPNIINLSSQGGNETWRWTVPTSHSLLQCSVYDRWGNAVYFADKTDQNIAWDGHLHSQPVEQGVYIYIIKVIDSQGKVSIMKGDVTVVW